ncbi:hypothetical protein [Microcella pacifica]|uniref:Lipoprotein n=1 Tax=Microcella pacifica TaxID=2591847 RepID=A0A9E5JQ32_9MICO|nr:hypothetical protein [Microcella pacifica]NHF63744.1 hypothetical protein [Microcella pacifica]
MSPFRFATSLFTIAVAATALSGCSAPEPQTTIDCKSAFNNAGIEQAALYRSHPFYADDFVELDLDTQAEIQADEEAKWAEIVEPIYTACDGPEDFFYSGVSIPAVFGVTSFEGLDLREEAGFILPSYCGGREDTPACEGWEEFLAGM